MPYILWIAAFNTLYLCGYIWLDLYFSPSPLKKSNSVYSSPSKLKVPVEHTPYGDEQYQTQDPAASAPELLAAINKNGLPIFLLVRPHLLCLDGFLLVFIGQHCDGPHQFDNSYDVHQRLLGNNCPGPVRLWNLLRGMGPARTEALVMQSVCCLSRINGDCVFLSR